MLDSHLLDSHRASTLSCLIYRGLACRSSLERAVTPHSSPTKKQDVILESGNPRQAVMPLGTRIAGSREQAPRTPQLLGWMSW